MPLFDVTIAGEINLDLVLYGLPQELPLEREVLASGFEVTLGSSSAILAHNLASLNLAVGFITRVGPDELGRIALNRLRDSAVDLSRVVQARDGVNTGATVILHHGEQRRILTYPGTMAEMSRTDLDLEYLASGRHFHLSSLFLQRGLQAELPAIFRELKSRGLTISLDTNDDPSNQWDGVLSELLPLIDILLPNRDELLRITRRDSLDEALTVLSPKVPIIAVKCGREGAVVQTESGRSHIPPVLVKVVDTIGAGDSFNAGFLAAWLSGCSAEQSAAAGNITGALSTLCRGGTEAFRATRQRNDFLKRHNFPLIFRTDGDVAGAASLRESRFERRSEYPNRKQNDRNDQNGILRSYGNVNPLKELLDLTVREKENQGLLYTPQEIARQPATWLRTWMLFEERLPDIQSFLIRAGVQLPPGERPIIYLVGAGTSDYIGQCLHHLLRQKWQCEVEAISSTSLLIDFSNFVLKDRPYLWISFSRSGDSPEGVAVLERALAEEPRISHLVVSCNETAKMIQMIGARENCLGVVLDRETNDAGLAMTSSFTNMVIFGQALAHTWSAAEYEPLVKTMSTAADSFLPVAATMAKSLTELGYKRACFVGSGVLEGIAQEAALKLLELTAGKVTTMSETTLGLRHGPMAALDQETLVVAFLSLEPTRRRYEIDLLTEIERKRLVGAVIAVVGCGASDLPTIEGVQVLAPPDHWILPDIYRPPLDVLFGQTLGLFFSLRNGLMPDSPSPNGVISRVVQPIEIY